MSVVDRLSRNGGWKRFFDFEFFHIVQKKTWKNSRLSFLFYFSLSLLRIQVCCSSAYVESLPRILWTLRLFLQLGILLSNDTVNWTLMVSVICQKNGGSSRKKGCLEERLNIKNRVLIDWRVLTLYWHRYPSVRLTIFSSTKLRLNFTVDWSLETV